MQKIKVVWICSFSKKSLRNRLYTHIHPFEKTLRWVLRKPAPLRNADGGAWICNALDEIVKFEGIELHVITPWLYLNERIQSFCEKGVTYHFVRDQNSTLTSFLFKSLFHIQDNEYRENSKVICELIDIIHPEIIHMFGAENPNYSFSALHIPRKYPLIVQLQTLVNEPKFLNDYYKGNTANWQYYASLEKRVINRADYIGTILKPFKDFIVQNIKPNVRFVDTDLALIEKINRKQEEKEYDCVYFAKDISKAVDLAIDAFALARQRRPSLSMLIIGGFAENFMVTLRKKIDRLGVADNIRFTGILPTYDDVISAIRKAKIALLPIKVDLITGTIRESMSNGIPVVTTDTGTNGTQLLNRLRDSVLLSKIGDSQAMADNIIRLLDDMVLYDTLRENSFRNREECDSNYVVVKKWIETYNEIII